MTLTTASSSPWSAHANLNARVNLAGFSAKAKLRYEAGEAIVHDYCTSAAAVTKV